MFSQVQGDVVFRRALRALPGPVQEALVRAELDDPVLLRSFRPASLEKLGLFEGGLRAHVLERLFPTGFGETSKVGDDMAVLGMDAMVASGTQSGVDIQLGSSRAKMRARKKRVAAEVQSSVVPSSGMLSSF